MGCKARRLLVLLALVTACRVAPLAAQTSDAPDPATVSVRIGPVMMNPAISLTNIGVDNNVFNEPNQALPKKDFTFTLSPNTDIWLRVGRTWVTGTLREDIVWYQKYASERSGNYTYGVGWKVPSTVAPFSVNANRASTRERPGFEIDARAQHYVTTYGATGELRVLSGTYVGVTASHEKTDFNQTAVFLGTNLQDALNRTTTTAGITVRRSLTPLTDVTFSATRSNDNFELEPLRNSTSTKFFGSVKFDPAALLKGTASFGYTHFTPIDPNLPAFTGTTGDLDLSYTFAGITKLAANATRAVNYSYDITQPYYILTGFTIGAAQQIFGPIDIVGTISVQRMAYQDRAGVVVEVVNRIDYVHTYGGGLGFHMGKDLRIGFNVTNSVRTSQVVAREFEGLHYGVALTYGVLNTGFGK